MRAVWQGAAMRWDCRTRHRRGCTRARRQHQRDRWPMGQSQKGGLAPDWRRFKCRFGGQWRDQRSCPRSRPMAEAVQRSSYALAGHESLGGTLPLGEDFFPRCIETHRLAPYQNRLGSACRRIGRRRTGRWCVFGCAQSLLGRRKRGWDRYAHRRDLTRGISRIIGTRAFGRGRGVLQSRTGEGSFLRTHRPDLMSVISRIVFVYHLGFGGRGKPALLAYVSRQSPCPNRMRSVMRCQDGFRR
jgi:hypothetical protein